MSDSELAIAQKNNAHALLYPARSSSNRKSYQCTVTYKVQQNRIVFRSRLKTKSGLLISSRNDSRMIWSLADHFTVTFQPSLRHWNLKNHKIRKCWNVCTKPLNEIITISEWRSSHDMLNKMHVNHLQTLNIDQLKGAPRTPTWPRTQLLPVTTTGYVQKTCWTILSQNTVQAQQWP
jgi:hypothetical protein